MAKTKLKDNRRQAPIGSMRHRVKLHGRKIVEPIFGETNFTEKFSGDDEVWAKVKTVNGKVFYGGAGVDTSLTHQVVIRFDSAVTSDSWVEFRGRNLKIVSSENLDENDQFMLLNCVDRGSKTVEASKA